MIVISDRVLPTHIALIMDGNGRWAEKRGLPRSAGHRQGVKTVGELVKYCSKIGLRYLTLYAFSTENWKRPQKEVDSLMNLIREYLAQADRYEGENVRSLFIGDRSRLDDDIIEGIERMERVSAENDGITVTIALNYGSRDEIVNAVKRISERVQSGELRPEEVSEPMLTAHLYTADIPDPDMIVRPSGEQRLSNFLMWQAAYSELIFMDVLWPDFTPKKLEEAISLYETRDRRFGGLKL